MTNWQYSSTFGFVFNMDHFLKIQCEQEEFDGNWYIQAYLDMESEPLTIEAFKSQEKADQYLLNLIGKQ